MREPIKFPETFEECEQILKNNDVSLAYSEEFTDGNGNVETIPEMGLWTLSWVHGFIGMGYSEDEIEKVHLKAAVFILLWKAGICASDSDKLSSYWADNNSIFSKMDI